MKVTLIQSLILIFIFTSCLEKSEKVTENKPQNPVLNQDCPINGLAGVKIQDAASTNVIGSKFLWDEITKNSKTESLPEARFLNANKSEVLSFIFHPGGLKNEISEFKLKKAQQIDMSLPIIKRIKRVQTDNGLYLGQSLSEVLKTLKDVKGLDIKENLISLRIESLDPFKSPCLKKHNMPIYYLKLSFDRNQKMDFLKFGYEYL